MMNSIPSSRAGVKFRFLALGLALAASVPDLISDTVRPPKSAEAAIRSFQDALFLSTRDRTANGRHAVDTYWKSTELSSTQKLDPDFYRKLSSLYADLTGDRLVRATLSDSGWPITGFHAPLVLTKGQRFTGLIIIISNQTSREQTATVAINSKIVNATEKCLKLDAGESVAFAPEMLSHTIGRFQAEVRIGDDRQARVSLSGEVRPAVCLRMRLLDAQESITPARVYVHGADALNHVAPGAVDRIMWMTGEHYFYTPGSIEMIVPAGKTRVEIRKGFDYKPIIRELDLTSHTVVAIDLHLGWLRNMNAAGWYGGDDHIHGNYVGEQWSTPADDLLAIRAEGLNVANLMVSNSVGGTIHDEHLFEGKPNALSTDNKILYWNQEMRTGSYGHLLLLNLKQLVRPLYTGFPGPEHWEDYPSNYSQAQQARDHGGVTVYAHPALAFDQIPTGSLAVESVADVALGAIDAFEVFCSHDEPSMELWYRFLNLGLRLAVAGGSDAFLNQRFTFLAGDERVYVYTGDHFSYATWIEGLRRGRSFATVGPLLTYEVNGNPPGSEQRVDSGTATVAVQVSVVSPIPIARIEVVANGHVVAEASSATPTYHLDWRGTVAVQLSSWLAARVWGPDNDRIANGPSRWSQRRSNSLVLLAHSSPSYVYLGRQSIFSEQSYDFCLRWLNVLVERTHKDGKFSSDTHRNEVLTTFLRARDVYEKMRITAAEAQR